VSVETRPFLSIIVPTYNRAAELDRQLAWLYGELGSLDVSWELRVHDNCSTDDTPAVTARWREAFGADRCHVVRHERNILGIPNFLSALHAAQGRWTWSIGDDDVLHDGTTQRIVDVVREQPDLALLYLDFCGIDPETGEVVEAHYFDPEVKGRIEDGRSGFVAHAAREIGSVISITATVYATDLAVESLTHWRGPLDNWALIAYITGYAATRGPIFVTPEVRMDCVIGVSHWQHESDRWVRATHHDIPSVFLQLAQQGYPPYVCRDLGLRALRHEGPLRSWRAHLHAVKACPAWLLVVPRLLSTRGSGPPARPSLDPVPERCQTPT
jgi:abequosyltransferase